MIASTVRIDGASSRARRTFGRHDRAVKAALDTRAITTFKEAASDRGATDDIDARADGCRAARSGRAPERPSLPRCASSWRHGQAAEEFTTAQGGIDGKIAGGKGIEADGRVTLTDASCERGRDLVG